MTLRRFLNAAVTTVGLVAAFAGTGEKPISAMDRAKAIRVLISTFYSAGNIFKEVVHIPARSELIKPSGLAHKEKQVIGLVDEIGKSRSFWVNGIASPSWAIKGI